MNGKFCFLASSIGLSLLLGACEPAAQTPTAPPAATPTGAPPAVPPAATPTVTPATP
ncbi:beta-Ig-H3/fasciclin [Nostoc sp. MG11]|uniref:beta-Ig-H3/fasciclin n=1 Tax=Nostoc sp. MG11 TaxID=2721166 RepID=UPI001867A2D8|nr:beta-Ig-H3/fasciclin [Nostoc sp. MG11]